MGVNFYADRGFVTVNGVEVGDLKSLKFTKDESVTVVETMTRNKRSAGFKQGNLKVTGSLEMEIQDQKAQIDLAFQYGNEVNVIFHVGTSSERYSLLGLTQNSADLNASVGETSKTINFMALDAVNENGNSVNSAIGF